MNRHILIPKFTKWKETIFEVQNISLIAFLGYKREKED